MDFITKCPHCTQYSVEPDFERTLGRYEEEYLKDIKILLPYEEPPLRPEFLVLSCNTVSCKFTEQVTLQELTERLRDKWSYSAWVKARSQVGTPENFEAYFEKYIYKKGLHKSISDSDRKKNPYIDRILKHVEKKHTKNSDGS